MERARIQPRNRFRFANGPMADPPKGGGERCCPGARPRGRGAAMCPFSLMSGSWPAGGGLLASRRARIGMVRTARGQVDSRSRRLPRSILQVLSSQRPEWKGRTISSVPVFMTHKSEPSGLRGAANGGVSIGPETGRLPAPCERIRMPEGGGRRRGILKPCRDPVRGPSGPALVKNAGRQRSG